MEVLLNSSNFFFFYHFVGEARKYGEVERVSIIRRGTEIWENIVRGPSGRFDVSLQLQIYTVSISLTPKTSHLPIHLVSHCPDRGAVNKEKRSLELLYGKVDGCVNNNCVKPPCMNERMERGVFLGCQEGINNNQLYFAVEKSISVFQRLMLWRRIIGFQLVIKHFLAIHCLYVFCGAGKCKGVTIYTKSFP